jgi:general secretion pathway protein G
MLSTYRRLKQRRDAGEIEGGFTLIELLIVIVVLGVLAAVVIFSLGGVTSQSAKSACQADGATLSTAMAAYNAQTGANPATDAALVGNGVQSWPANFPHYAFGLVSGVLYVNTDQASAATWSATPISTGTGVAVYTSPASCSAVS